MKKQKKYRSLNRYYIRTGINRMLKLYNQATKDEKKAGINWYKNAHKFCNDLAEKNNINKIVSYLVTAQISPGVNWELNKEQARELTQTYYKNINTVPRTLHQATVWNTCNHTRILRIPSSFQTFEEKNN